MWLENRFTDDGKVISPTHRPRSTAQEVSWYSFLLEAESAFFLNLSFILTSYDLIIFITLVVFVDAVLVPAVVFVVRQLN
jgi:hypothetical protein